MYSRARLGRVRALRFIWSASVGAAAVFVASSHTHRTQFISHGTFYAVERTLTMVALSIDSSRSELHGNDTHYHLHAACKLHGSAGSLFVTAGMVGGFSETKSRDDRAPFHEIIGDVLLRTTRGSEIIPQLNQRLIPFLISNLRPPAAVAFWPDGSSVLQVVIARSENGVPYLRAVDYMVRRRGAELSVLPNVITCP